MGDVMQMTITLGDVLTIAGFVITGVSVFISIANRITRVETKLDPIWEWFLDLKRRGGQ